jgi:hypothetical protein
MQLGIIGVGNALATGWLRAALRAHYATVVEAASKWWFSPRSGKPWPMGLRRQQISPARC